MLEKKGLSTFTPPLPQYCNWEFNHFFAFCRPCSPDAVICSYFISRKQTCLVYPLDTLSHKVSESEMSNRNLANNLSGDSLPGSNRSHLDF